MYEYRIQSVDRVIDGDTIDVTIDLGFKVLIKERIRLYGINTPESRTRDLEEKKRGIAAKERLHKILWDAERAGYKLAVQTEKAGKFGRYLGVIFTINDRSEEPVRVNVNQQLVEEGHAVPYFGGKR